MKGWLFKPTYKNHNGTKGKSDKWYCGFRDEAGKVHKVPLFKDKQASRARMNEILTEWEQREAGIIDKYTDTRRVPVGDLVKAFKGFLKAKGNCAKHVGSVTNEVEWIIKGIKAKVVTDITADKVQLYFSERQAPKKVEGCEEMVPGMSNESVNHYVQSIKSFLNWLIKSGRYNDNPLRSLSLLNGQVDKRLVRRNLTEAELSALIAVVRQAKNHHRMSGPERALVYGFTASTGLRSNEMRSIGWCDLDLESEQPSITVQAHYSKSRKRDILPLANWLVTDLLKYRQTVPHDRQDKVFPRLTEKTAEMLKKDLKEAGIAEQDDAGRILDFHSLRHTFISLLALSGVHPKTAQELARHSDINLTMNCYTHTLLEQRAAAVAKIPSFGGNLSNTGGHNPLRKTGTD